MKAIIDQHRTVRVEDRLGLHMRVAQQIVQTALRFHSTLTIRRGSILADARSILGVLRLGGEPCRGPFWTCTPAETMLKRLSTNSPT